ncbi:MAG: serine hydrolase [Planctomycetota bacterium]
MPRLLPGPAFLATFLASFVLSVTALLAQEVSPSLEQRLERLCHRIERDRSSEHVPGLALAVVKDDAVLLARGFGWRDVANELPVTPETLFAIGSTTMPFTASLVAMLVDEGKMEWDNRVTEYLPDLHFKDKEADARATLRDLLCHRTGLRSLSLLWAGGLAARDEILHQVGEAEPFCPFRSRFLFNNVMFVAAGEAAARAAGSDWDSLIRERLLEPLGMKGTTTSVAVMQEDARAARGYAWDEDARTWELLPIRDPSSIAPAGAILSNALDMAQWVRFLLARGEHHGMRLLSAGRFEEMWAEQISTGPGRGCGLGWALREHRGKRVVEHGGNIDGFASRVAMMPDEKIGCVVLANVTFTALVARIPDLVFDTLLHTWKDEDALVPLSAEELEPYLGRFRHEKGRVDFTVLEQDGHLALDIPGQAVFTMKWPDSRGRWIFELTEQLALEFHRSPSGAVDRATFYQGPVHLDLRRVTQAAPSPIALDELVELVRGGLTAEAIDRLRGVRLTGTVRFVHQGVSGRVTVVAAGTDRYREEIDLGRFGWTRRACDGKRAWSRSSREPFRELRGAHVEEARFGHPFVWFAEWRERFARIEVEQELEVGGRSVYQVRVVPRQGPPSRLYVDASSGEITRIERPQLARGLGTLPQKIQLEDFRDVEGVSLPFRLITESELFGRSELQYDAVETGLPIDDAAFVLKEVE